jgi:hypothetical protein
MTGSRGREGNELLRRQETLLAVTGQVVVPLYSITMEAVLRLEHPIRGIDTSHTDSEIIQSIMMDTYYIRRLWMMKMKWKI